MYQSSPGEPIPSGPLQVSGSSSQMLLAQSGQAQGVLAWSSFVFAVLQSICTFFAAVGGLRLIVGAGALAIGAGTAQRLVRFHLSWVRLPMILFAVFGSLLNLAILFQIRRLRSRPASAWRQKPLSPRRLHMEKLEFGLAIATLVLVVVEEYFHLRLTHTL